MVVKAWKIFMGLALQQWRTVACFYRKYFSHQLAVGVRIASLLPVWKFC